MFRRTPQYEARLIVIFSAITCLQKRSPSAQLTRKRLSKILLIVASESKRSCVWLKNRIIAPLHTLFITNHSRSRKVARRKRTFSENKMRQTKLPSNDPLPYLLLIAKHVKVKLHQLLVTSKFLRSTLGLTTRKKWSLRVKSCSWTTKTCRGIEYLQIRGSLLSKLWRITSYKVPKKWPTKSNWKRLQRSKKSSSRSTVWKKARKRWSIWGPKCQRSESLDQNS